MACYWPTAHFEPGCIGPRCVPIEVNTASGAERQAAASGRAEPSSLIDGANFLIFIKFGILAYLVYAARPLSDEATDLSKRQTRIRPWYAGKTQPDEEVLAFVESVDPAPQLLYDQSRVSECTGEFADAMRGLYHKMDLLKRRADDFRTWNTEDGYVTFYETLLDIAPEDTRGRVKSLQQLGSFKFRSGSTPEDMKNMISAVFAEEDERESAHMFSSIRSRRLSQIWAPPEDSLLDYILSRPAQTGRVLADRLNPSNTTPFRLIGHPFDGIRSTELEVIKNTGTLAFERDSEIHLIGDVRKTLENWDEDAIAIGGVEQVTLLDTLLLHELVELVIDEISPEFSPVNSHIVATTFERYLKGTMLKVGVEDFFLEWPPLSEEEIEERNAAYRLVELEEVNALFAEEQAPEDDEADLDDLPMDDVPVRRKKKKKKKKVAVQGKKKLVKKRPRE